MTGGGEASRIEEGREEGLKDKSNRQNRRTITQNFQRRTRKIGKKSRILPEGPSEATRLRRPGDRRDS
jgi:hypothetical protein